MKLIKQYLLYPKIHQLTNYPLTSSCIIWWCSYFWIKKILFSIFPYFQHSFKRRKSYQNYAKIPLIQHNHGFTLIEILISMSILAVISTLTFSGLNTVLHTKEVLSDNQKLFGKIQRAVIIMERDFLQIAPRSIHTGLFREYAINGKKNEVEFTRAGRPLLLNSSGSIFMRVKYTVDSGQLIRYSWQAVDRLNSEQPTKNILLNNVISLTFKFYDKKSKSWRTDWPNMNPNQSTDSKLNSLPAYLKFELKLEKFGTIVRLLPGVG